MAISISTPTITENLNNVQDVVALKDRTNTVHKLQDTALRDTVTTWGQAVVTALNSLDSTISTIEGNDGLSRTIDDTPQQVSANSKIYLNEDANHAVSIQVYNPLTSSTTGAALSFDASHLYKPSGTYKGLTFNSSGETTFSITWTNGTFYGLSWGGTSITGAYGEYATVSQTNGPSLKVNFSRSPSKEIVIHIEPSVNKSEWANKKVILDSKNIVVQFTDGIDITSENPVSVNYTLKQNVYKLYLSLGTTAPNTLDISTQGQWLGTIFTSNVNSNAFEQTLVSGDNTTAKKLYAIVPTQIAESYLESHLQFYNGLAYSNLNNWIYASTININDAGGYENEYKVYVAANDSGSTLTWYGNQTIKGV